MTARGMDTDDARLVKLIAKRVGCCLRGQRDEGASRPRMDRADGGVAVVRWPANLSGGGSTPTTVRLFRGRRCE